MVFEDVAAVLIFDSMWCYNNYQEMFMGLLFLIFAGIFMGLKALIELTFVLYFYLWIIKFKIIVYCNN